MGGGPLGGEVLQIAVVIGSKAAVCAAADLAFCLVAAVRLAAGALAVFAVALIAGAGAGVGAVAVGRPFAPVVAESVALGDLATLQVFGVVQVAAAQSCPAAGMSVPSDSLTSQPLQ